MSNLLDHFRREVEILRKKHNGDELIIDSMLPQIEALIMAFGEEGHSGASASIAGPVIVQTIKRAFAFEPLSPLTGDDDEWNDISEEMGSKEKCFQNKRLSSVFKDEKGIYYLNAIVWKELPDGGNWSGSVKLSDGREIRSSAYIKDLNNFHSKSFYIDVKDVCEEEGGTEFEIINPEQLKEAEEVYELRYRE